MPNKSQRGDTERLALFVLRVDQMVELAAFKEGNVKVQLNMQLGGPNSMEAKADFGDPDQLRSLLVAFRRFTAPGEDVFFEAIANLVEQHVSDEPCRTNFRLLRAKWKKAKTGAFGLNIGERSISGQDAFDLVVNGQMFHDDADKEAYLLSLTDQMQTLVQALMVNLVIDCIQILMVARNNLRPVIAARPAPS